MRAMTKYLFLIFLSCSLLASDLPTVKMVSNFSLSADSVADLLRQNGVQAHVVLSDLAEYGPGLMKNRSKWGRIVRKFRLDFPHRIAVGDDVQRIVFYNTTTRYSRNLALRKLPKEKLVLFMWEPPAIIPKMYSKNLHAKFGRVYTFDDTLVDNVKYFKFYYPVLQPMIQDVVPFEEKKLCTLVATHFAPKRIDSLYGERIAAIRFFEKIGETGFEFYGRRWNPAEYPSYRGGVADKIEAIKNYRFSICYENTADLAGYITEKIFDCFAAGNVPIYWGASNVTDHIPKECFIDRRDFATMEELYSYIKNMGKEEYEAYLAHIRTYLQSDQAKAFSAEAFGKIFAQAVQGL